MELFTPRQNLSIMTIIPRATLLGNRRDCLHITLGKSHSCGISIFIQRTGTPGMLCAIFTRYSIQTPRVRGCRPLVSRTTAPCLYYKVQSADWDGIVSTRRLAVTWACRRISSFHVLPEFHLRFMWGAGNPGAVKQSCLSCGSR